MSDVTRILDRACEGDHQAAQELLPLVYEDLRTLAASKLAREAPGQTLQATALVHEAWLRLAGAEPGLWRGRDHFFRVAAEVMRRILIDRARARRTQKRSADVVPLEDSSIGTGTPSDEMLAVHEALDELAREDPDAADMVKLRYFVGLTIPEIAELMHCSPSTVDRNWTHARAWLKRAVRSSDPPH